MFLTDVVKSSRKEINNNLHPQPVRWLARLICNKGRASEAAGRDVVGMQSVQGSPILK